MKRLNFKQLKEELNKLPDELLECFSITHKGSTEDPEAEFSLIFVADESTDEWNKCMELFEHPSMKKIDKHFVQYLNKDFKDMRDEDKFERKMERGDFEELDW